MIRNHFFTLVELIVVIAIVGLLSSIAVTRFRGESPSVMMERVSSEFAAFCTRTRFKALSQGKEYAIVFQPETGTFFAKAMNQNVSWIANKQNDLPEDTESSSNEKYTLPEEFDFVADSLFNQNAADELAQSDDNTVEVFRFFPDGCASDSRSLVLQYRSVSRSFHVSGLTGLVFWKENQEEI